MNIDVILTYSIYLNSAKIWAPGLQQTSADDKKNIYRINNLT